jgi:hypothetical protein
MRSLTRHTCHVVVCYALTHKAHRSCGGMLCAHTQGTRVMCWHVMRSLTRHTGHVLACYALTHKAHGSCGGMLCAHSQGTRVMWWYVMRSLTRHTGHVVVCYALTHKTHGYAMRLLAEMYRAGVELHVCTFNSEETVQLALGPDLTLLFRSLTGSESFRSGKSEAVLHHMVRGRSAQVHESCV